MAGLPTLCSRGNKKRCRAPKNPPSRRRPWKLHDDGSAVHGRDAANPQLGIVAVREIGPDGPTGAWSRNRRPLNPGSPGSAPCATP